MLVLQVCGKVLMCLCCRCVERCLCACVAGVWKGVRERVRARQAQADAQRRTEIRVQYVRQGVQTAGSPVSHVTFRLYQMAFVYRRGVTEA